MKRIAGKVQDRVMVAACSAPAFVHANPARPVLMSCRVLPSIHKRLLLGSTSACQQVHRKSGQTGKDKDLDGTRPGAPREFTSPDDDGTQLAVVFGNSWSRAGLTDVDLNDRRTQNQFTGVEKWLKGVSRKPSTIKFSEMLLPLAPL
ncbi:mg chelatase-like protein [Anopheles sinensis]|uniref:Mg chelatase-like protein n=1 Tax=Anopheles sinensis TaxID=74873 RepID=A0A084VSB8_ANOSI|nr:mg chelatase-like protein [Anopheles sinensis]